MSTGSTGSTLNLLRVTDAVHADAMIKYCSPRPRQSLLSRSRFLFKGQRLYFLFITNKGISFILIISSHLSIDLCLLGLQGSLSVSASNVVSVRCVRVPSASVWYSKSLVDLASFQIKAPN